MQGDVETRLAALRKTLGFWKLFFAMSGFGVVVGVASTFVGAKDSFPALLGVGITVLVICVLMSAFCWRKIKETETTIAYVKSQAPPTTQLKPTTENTIRP